MSRKTCTRSFSVAVHRRQRQERYRKKGTGKAHEKKRVSSALGRKEECRKELRMGRRSCRWRARLGKKGMRRAADAIRSIG
jgi:hypothetical protein